MQRGLQHVEGKERKSKVGKTKYTIEKKMIEGARHTEQKEKKKVRRETAARVDDLHVSLLCVGRFPGQDGVDMATRLSQPCSLLQARLRGVTGRDEALRHDLLLRRGGQQEY